MTNPASIRTMRWWDIQRVHVIEAAVFPKSAWTVEMFWSELAGVPDTRWYVVAESADDVVGYAGLRAVPPEADVQTLAVAPAAQRAGIGQRLLDTLVDEARRRHCTRLFLEVAADNAAAQLLYQRNAFEVTARRSNYYGHGLDAVMMQRSLLDETVAS